MVHTYGGFRSLGSGIPTLATASLLTFYCLQYSVLLYFLAVISFSVFFFFSF
jgi:hypothetical protein